MFVVSMAGTTNSLYNSSKNSRSVQMCLTLKQLLALLPNAGLSRFFPLFIKPRMCSDEVDLKPRSRRKEDRLRSKRQTKQMLIKFASEIRNCRILFLACGGRQTILLFNGISLA